MAAHLAEGKAFYALKQKVISELKDEKPEVIADKLKELGPPSASQYAAVLEALTENEPNEGDPARPFWALVKKHETELKVSKTWEPTARAAGTWITKKAHGSTRKIIAKPRLSDDLWSAVISLLRREGLVVHQGQKAPRDGVHRAVQSLIK